MRFATCWALLWLLFGTTSAMPEERIARPNGRPANLGPVPQAHVDPRVITLPVVDAEDISFTRLSTQDGLSQTRVTQILQDDRGFIWFPSQYGLNRYDGYKFRVFKHEPGRPNSLSGVLIHSLFKDHSGMLWIGFDESLDKFDPVTEAVTHYHIADSDAQGETFPVMYISQDRAGMLWLATSGGLFGLDPSTGQTIRYQHDPNNPFSLSSNVIRFTDEDSKGTFWVASTEGLDAFDRKTGRVTLHIPLHEPGQISFHEDRFGVLWIVHFTGGGLAAFDPKTNTVTQYSIDKAHVSAPLPTGMMGVLEDRDGTLWFGTMGNGLLKFDRKGMRFIRYRHDPTNPESIGEDDVGPLFQDREGNIWAALNMMAPNHFAVRPPLFEKFSHEPGKKDSLSGTMVNGIYEDRQGILWISAIDALNRVDRKTGHYTFYRIAGTRVDWSPTAIIEDRSGFLWVGSAGHGLIRFDPRTGRFEAFRHSATDRFSLSDDFVDKLLIDRAGTLWATTFDGLDRFDFATSRFTVYKAEKQNAQEVDVDLKEDSEGALWIGTDASGLQHFDPQTEQFTVYKHSPNDPMSLSNNRVNSIYFDHLGTMWVGTQDGLDKFDRSTGTFKSYYEQDGLSGNVVSCILEDERGNLWMSTNNGVSKFDPLRQTFKTYSTTDGLPGTDLSGWGACYKSLSGEMFFGGFSGGVAFHPDKVADTQYIPPVVLTDFLLIDRSVKVGADSALSKSIAYTNVLSLSHDKNLFSLEFSALSYFNPASNRYRYKLEGFDRQWHEVASNQRMVTYTTLPAGTYTFRVQGATNRGAWSEPGVALSLEILPAWWNTRLFRAVCVVISLALVWALYQLRLRQLAKQFNARLEERISERTRIARELHDSLLQGFQGLMFRLQAVRDQLPGRPREAMKALDIALERGDKVIVEARDTVTDLRQSIVGDGEIAEALTALNEELTVLSGNHGAPCMRVLVEGKQRALNPMVRDEIYRIAREALRNAFHHAKAQKIETQITYGDSEFVLYVRDDGSGIVAVVVNQRARTGHWGLSGMRERAKSFGGKLEVWSEHRAGTEIALIVPASTAYSASDFGRRFWLWRRKTEASKWAPGLR